MIARPKSNQEFYVALLIAAWAHVAIFFAFVALLVFDLLSAKVIDGERPEKPKPEEFQMSFVYEESPPLEAPAMTRAPEVAPPEPVQPPLSGFVQTQADQEIQEKPNETAFIGERDTQASSDVGALAGKVPLPALAGETEMKEDVKTFNSDFADGANSGPQEGTALAGQGGPGEAAMTEVETTEAQDATKPTKPVEQEVLTSEEKMAEPENDELAAIDEALKTLEEALAETEEPVAKVAETMPEKKATKASESASQDGGFAPKTKKTRVRGVMSASGKGSLDVKNTPAGRYEAKIYKLLERSWQMENIRNRSLIAPGNISLYFAVDRKGQVSKQQQIAMNGASDTQFGMILRALSAITIPKMPQDVIDELEGDALELTVTFNY